MKKTKWLILISALLAMSCTKDQSSLFKELTGQKRSFSSALAPSVMRIALSHDGNIHDRDDICAVSLEMGLIAKSGMQSSLVYAGYSDHWWKTTSAQQTDEKNSVINSMKSWGGFDSTKFIDVQKYHAHAVAMLRDEILKSTATDSLRIAALGPMQVVGEGIADAKAYIRANNITTNPLQYVTVISHSQWNNEHAGRYGAGEGLALPRYNFDATNSSLSPGATFISNMGVNVVKIKDQNYTVSAPYSSYTWLQKSTDPRLRAIYSECKDVAAKSTFDCSDAGVVWYILKNDQDGSPSKLQSFFNVTTDTTTTKVNSFTLVNSSTDQDIKTLNNGDVLSISALGKNWNIRANATSATGSVTFNLTGHQSNTRTEKVLPYALFGDINGNYNNWTPTIGSYNLKCTPYSTGGSAGIAYSIGFSVTN